MIYYDGKWVFQNLDFYVHSKKYIYPISFIKWNAVSWSRFIRKGSTANRTLASTLTFPYDANVASNKSLHEQKVLVSSGLIKTHKNTPILVARVCAWVSNLM